jgi:hypothetical protein
LGWWCNFKVTALYPAFILLQCLSFPISLADGMPKAYYGEIHAVEFAQAIFRHALNLLEKVMEAGGPG